MSTDRRAWRTSSYSSNGESCVDVAPVLDPRAWRTASYSSNGEKCVDVAPVPGHVDLRHSKQHDAGEISFPLAAWQEFLADVRRGSSANPVATITADGTDTLLRHAEVELRFDSGEWTAFQAGVADGEFDFTRGLR